MVRLKVNWQNSIVTMPTDFNSSMVRLKVEAETLDSLVEYIFQFQYGAIKSQLGYKGYIQLANFNSSMVRLKAITFKQIRLPIYISIPVWCD